jgi:hypothetical protein
MDAIRGGRLAISGEVCDVLLRTRDILGDLVENARNGVFDPLPPAASLIAELAALSGATPRAGRR